MKVRTIYILVLIFGLLSFSANSQNLNLDDKGRPTFDINSSTLILDRKGNSIDFKTFIRLLPGSDYSDLQPKFRSDGQLESISIKLSKPLHKPEPKKVVVQQSTPTYSNVGTYVSTTPKTQTYSSPKVDRAPIKRSGKFKFTTAKELEGLQAPFFSEKDISGNTYSSSNLLGKVIVIKFWFLRCGPCLEEIPALNELADKYRNNPQVTFLAPATDKFEAVQKFMTKKDFRYKVLYDTYDIHGDYKVAGYPTHMIIHKNGTVAKVYTGKNSNLVHSISQVIEQALILQSDDKSMVEVPQPLYTSDKVFKAEEGYALSKEQYLQKLTSGLYNIFLKEKTDGRKEYFLMKK